MLTLLTKGRGGLSQLLTIAVKWGRGVQTPPNMADIICEQSLIDAGKSLKLKIYIFIFKLRYHGKVEPEEN